MTPQELQKRFRDFALRILRMVETLPRRLSTDVLAKQLVKAATSAAANYRAACRARSVADFISKMGIVEEETDESVFWMELLCDAQIVTKPRLEPLMQEGNELVSITVSSIKTARGKSRQRREKATDARGS
jgi:four helix bundle protein